MTIPTLIQKYQERQIVSGLTKTYSMLSNAYTMMKAEYGNISTWGMSSTVTGETDESSGESIYDYSANKLLSERFRKYLKVAKVCETNKVCYPGAYYSLSGMLRREANSVESEEGPGVSATAEQKFYLQDGTFIEFGWYTAPNGSIKVTLPIDNKSILGKNTFYFVFNDDKFVPEGKASGSPEIHQFSMCDPANSSIDAGRGCAAWVLYNKNLDYMHCRDKLSWQEAHSCDESA